MPDALTITREWMELLDGIADAEEFRKTFLAVWQYAIDGKEADGLSPIGECVFMTIKKKIQTRKRVARFYTKHKSEALESNAKSVRIKRKNLTQKAYESNADDLFPETSNQHSITDITPHSLFKNKQDSPHGEKSTARRVFKVPTLEEVKAYIKGKGYSVDPEEFYSFYESQGWNVGKNKMRDWHKAVSYWQCRINNRFKTKTQLRDYSGI